MPPWGTIQLLLFVFNRHLVSLVTKSRKTFPAFHLEISEARESGGGKGAVHLFTDFHLLWNLCKIQSVFFFSFILKTWENLKTGSSLLKRNCIPFWHLPQRLLRLMDEGLYSLCIENRLCMDDHSCLLYKVAVSQGLGSTNEDRLPELTFRSSGNISSQIPRQVHVMVLISVSGHKPFSLFQRVSNSVLLCRLKDLLAFTRAKFQT